MTVSSSNRLTKSTSALYCILTIDFYDGLEVPKRGMFMNAGLEQYFRRMRIVLIVHELEI